MKILITTDTYYPVVNGVVRSLLNLKNSLENLGHEVRVLTLSNTLSSYKTHDTYYVGSLSAKRIYPEARVSNILASTHLRAIKKWEPDVIHSQSEFSTFIMAKTLSNLLTIPLIHTYHTLYEDYTGYVTSNKKAGYKLVSVASKTLVDMCDYVISPTEKTARVLESYKISRDKMEIIPTGIVIPEIYNENLRAELGISNDKKILLYLGRLAEEKNIEEVIEFYERIDNDDLALYIVGGGPYLNTLIEFGQSQEKDINFVGMVDPSLVNKYYQAADIFVTASESETQGLTYYEALSNGTPVIAREDSSLEGVVIDGYNGYTYENFDEFKSYIDKILADDSKKDKLSANARAYAIENFSVDSFGKKCEDLYEKAIKESKYESSFIFKRL